MNVVHYGLCQDCLKVHKGTRDEIDSLHAEESFCGCGGQVCSCPSCVESAREILRVGVRAHVLANPGLFNPEYVAQLKAA